MRLTEKSSPAEAGCVFFEGCMQSLWDTASGKTLDSKLSHASLFPMPALQENRAAFWRRDFAQVMPGFCWKKITDLADVPARETRANTHTLVILGSRRMTGWRLWWGTLWYTNIDPENHQFLMENSLPTPMTARVYVKLPEGKWCINWWDLVSPADPL